MGPRAFFMRGFMEIDYTDYLLWASAPAQGLPELRPGNQDRRRNGEFPPSIADAERAERLREVLDALFEVNKTVPIIVEGKKDAAALRKLGFLGEIVTLHRGKSMYEFCEDIAGKCRRVVLLLDWDPEGEGLMQKVGMDLKGHWEEHSRFRDLLKVLCQKEVKDIEGIPRLLRRLEGNEGSWQ
jgi:5S rRNA maturation endonuclease (ribonuclease M5)